MDGVPDAGTAIAVITVAAGYALLIERIIEGLKHLVEGSLSGDVENITIKQVENANQKGDAHIDAVAAEIAGAAAVEAEFAPDEDEEDEFGEMDELAFERTAVVTLCKLEPTTSEDVDSAHRRLFYLLAALGIGIALAWLMPTGILSALFGSVWQSGAGSMADRLLTGIVIAGGSQPVHVMLRFLTTRSAAPGAPATETEPETPAADTELKEGISPARLTATVTAAGAADSAGWIPIPYQGGVRPESLEERNYRSGDPNLIVYHHTAMSSSTGFQAVVDEFLVNKGWSTGYHCVVMPDGTIRPFCRWDRRGNHSKGRNDRSLGVAFHGNFHADPNDNFSNHDGRFGIQKPTSQQLDSGARVIALWVLLYDEIELDFGSSVLAHRTAKPGGTVCPGSNFPQDELEGLVEQYVNDWRQDEAVMAEVNAYRNKPYLYTGRAVEAA